MLRSNVPNQQLTTALPVLDALIYDELDKYPDYIPDVFRIYQTNRWGEQTTTVAGIKPAVVKPEGGAVVFDDPIDGYAKTYIPVTYAIAVSFSEELVEDDRLNMVEDTYRSLGLAMYQTRQITSFNIFNNGFVDTGPDGVSLFNTAHVMVGGNTYANRPTVDIALSVAGLRQMEVSMMRQVNHRGINVAVMPETVIVPPELSQTADELLYSVGRPDTAARADNTFKKHNYNLVASPFLTSTTAWFAISRKPQHQLRFYERVAPSTKTWIDEKSGSVNTRIRCRFDVSYSDFVGAWGTTG